MTKIADVASDVVMSFSAVLRTASRKCGLSAIVEPSGREPPYWCETEGYDRATAGNYRLLRTVSLPFGAIRDERDAC